MRISAEALKRQAESLLRSRTAGKPSATASLHAQPGDMVAVIGKGHEDYQEINGVRHHFLDREVIEETVKELGEKA